MNHYMFKRSVHTKLQLCYVPALHTQRGVVWIEFNSNATDFSRCLSYIVKIGVNVKQFSMTTKFGWKEAADA